MSDHYQYLDSFYRSSNVDSGSIQLNYCLSYPIEHATATASSTSSSVAVHTSAIPVSVRKIMLRSSFSLIDARLCDNLILISFAEEECSENREAEFMYTVKIINSGCGGYLVKKWATNARFSTATEMQQQLEADFAAVLQGASFHFGYIQRGHGVKGRQFTITADEDVNSMYDEYRGRGDIILWLKTSSSRLAKSTPTDERHKSDKDHGRKQPAKSSKGEECATGRSYQGHLSKMSEVQQIVEDLEQCNGDKSVYSPEQLRVWAHMIHMKKHTSYTDPPDKPFFRRSKGKPKVSTSSESELSPVKRINLRTECINQLDKWHMLLEKGAITTDQYKQLQDTILDDIKQF